MIVGVAVATLLLAAFAAEAGTISLRRSAESGEAIHLADVASLKGKDAQKLEKIEIARFRDGEQERVVSLSQVREALDQQDVNWGRLSITGFMECRVVNQQAGNAQKTKDKPNGDTREPAAERSDAASSDPHSTANVSRAVEAGQAGSLRQKIRRAIYRMSDAGRNALTIEFAERDAERLDQSILGKRYELEPRSSSALGRVPFAVRVYEGGRVADRFTISATVKRQVKAVVATQAISRGDPFEPGTTTLKAVSLERDAQPITDSTLVEGQRADGMLRKGEVIYPEDVKSPTLVKRGQLITVRCLAGDLVVRTVARAQADGARGDVIKARNESSRETFTCKVTGPRRAVVNLPEHNDADPTVTQAKGTR